MNETEIKKAAKAIRDYCKKQDYYCTHCVFRKTWDNTGICTIGKLVPEDWQLDEVNVNDKL